MICPYCGKEMQRGEICAGRGIAVWRPSHGVFTLPPGVAVSPTVLDTAAENGYCMECGVLVVRPNPKHHEQFKEKYTKYCEKKQKQGRDEA